MTHPDRKHAAANPNRAGIDDRAKPSDLFQEWMEFRKEHCIGACGRGWRNRHRNRRVRTILPCVDLQLMYDLWELLCCTLSLLFNNGMTTAPCALVFIPDRPSHTAFSFYLLWISSDGISNVRL